ncbi:2Fe-2S iron-sulfur cluster binding domain-containing protein [Raineyella sp. LH-20]|uniref:2Fe-2S iron-sulfur cluster binding domain-containing protein n=1 Tax=Raineyella sp. LH-20 TaxID=3081204 RepID=UPI002952BE55|nr:2Fe-2S iron-sulfur cluster binding domain-containing protein [Raineyella sp. LH-20]WOP18258.1 2Fe-2S iron-sulfur cluster binding domain-containing protein [Raineyella sp. LH-20]
MTIVEGTEMTVPQTASRHIALRFTDGQVREFDADPGETLLAAARRAGHRLVSQCTVGTCGTCVGTLVDGAGEMPSDRISTLSADELAAGQRLLCQTRALCDSSFDLDYPATLLEAHPPVGFRARITRLTWVADTVVELELKVPKAIKFGFTAGQYCRIQVPGTDEWRSYSIASGEHERFRLTFLIRILPSGVMSDFLRDAARTGQSLEVEGPLGGFVLEPAPRPTVLIAGGTGLAPMLSMLDRLRTVQPTPPILLLFGCNRPAELFHEDELAARISLMPTLEVRTVLMDNAGRDDLPAGTPLSVLRADDVAPDTVSYLCGPPPMIRAAEEQLGALGLPAHDIRAEQFVPSEN